MIRSLEHFSLSFLSLSLSFKFIFFMRRAFVEDLKALEQVYLKPLQANRSKLDVEESQLVHITGNFAELLALHLSTSSPSSSCFPQFLIASYRDVGGIPLRQVKGGGFGWRPLQASGRTGQGAQHVCWQLCPNEERFRCLGCQPQVSGVLGRNVALLLADLPFNSFGLREKIG